MARASRGEGRVTPAARDALLDGTVLDIRAGTPRDTKLHHFARVPQFPRKHAPAACGTVERQASEPISDPPGSEVW